MIGVIFEFGSSMIEVRVNGNDVYFRSGGGGFATIEQIQLSKEGSIKEHPDLKDDVDWKQKTIERFKEKIKSLEGETNKMKYIMDDLSRYGYKAKYLQRAGHRVQKIR